MGKSRTSFELFLVPGGLAGQPEKLDAATFVELGALEVQDIERWIRGNPALVGEDLMVVSNQFAKFEGSKDRLDLLAIDRHGALVVVEVKRDTSGAYQDLQALRYAAFAATFRSEQIVEAYVDYIEKTEDRRLSADEARDELQAFVDNGDLGLIDDQEQPRVILVAGGFESGVTTTVLWLRRTTSLDITCVQLVPYELEGQLLLGSSILIPLPEAKDYEVKVAEKIQAANVNRTVKLDHEAAKAFIASIPRGRWAAYGDVARAGGSPKGAMGVGAWLASPKTVDVPNIYRVLNAIGEVSPAWKATTDDLPPDPEGVRELLASEGVEFDEHGRAALSLRWRFEDYERAWNVDGADNGQAPGRMPSG